MLFSPFQSRFLLMWMQFGKVKYVRRKQVVVVEKTSSLRQFTVLECMQYVFCVLRKKTPSHIISEKVDKSESGLRLFLVVARFGTSIHYLCLLLVSQFQLWPKSKPYCHWVFCKDKTTTSNLSRIKTKENRGTNVFKWEKVDLYKEQLQLALYKDVVWLSRFTIVGQSERSEALFAVPQVINIRWT